MSFFNRDAMLQAAATIVAAQIQRDDPAVTQVEGTTPATLLMDAYRTVQAVEEALGVASSEQSMAVWKAVANGLSKR